jgi:ABC-type multidrug transport system fused ATPase/permease subunit
MVTAIVGAFAKFGKHLEAFYDLMASMEELGELLDVPLERETGNEVLARTTSTSLVLREVQLGPAGNVTKPLTLSIPAGSRVAVVGPPGSGKSLLLESLFGLHELAAGYIEINGFDVREIRLDDLRASTAVVREPEIIEGTVLDNLVLGRIGIDVSAARAALASVGLLDAVMRLPLGIDTHISATRPRMSHSQQIALMCARAILGTPGLLLIDGAIDDLHGELHAQVTRTIFAPEAAWTVILVTRREDTAVYCTHALRLPEGGFGPLGNRPLGVLTTRLEVAECTP